LTYWQSNSVETPVNDPLPVFIGNPGIPVMLQDGFCVGSTRYVELVMVDGEVRDVTLIR
jgi:hypothetical protein